MTERRIPDAEPIAGARKLPAAEPDAAGRRLPSAEPAPAGGRAARKVPPTASPHDGGVDTLMASRLALLDGRGCRQVTSAGGPWVTAPEGHTPWKWHICYACFPEAATSA